MRCEQTTPFRQQGAHRTGYLCNTHANRWLRSRPATPRSIRALPQINGDRFFARVPESVSTPEKVRLQARALHSRKEGQSSCRRPLPRDARIAMGLRQTGRGTATTSASARNRGYPLGWSDRLFADAVGAPLPPSSGRCAKTRSHLRQTGWALRAGDRLRCRSTALATSTTSPVPCPSGTRRVAISERECECWPRKPRSHRTKQRFEECLPSL